MTREIKPKMFQWIDNQLQTNGVAQHAVYHKDARLLLAQAASVCVGIREKTGKNDGEFVELMQETVGKAYGEPWCMSAVQTLVAYVEEKLNVKSPLHVSEHVLTTWRNTPLEQRIKFYPLPGAVIIWRHGKTSSGHTGIVAATDGNTIYAYEGNTTGGVSDQDEIVREGGGFYFTKRSIHGVGSMRVVGFLKPF